MRGGQRLNPRPNNRTSLRTYLKLAFYGSAVAAALILVVYYVTKPGDDERERPVADVTDFQWRKNIEINPRFVAGKEVMKGFPVFIQFEDEDLRNEQFGGMIYHEDGKDFIFVDNEGLLLDFQVEHYDPMAGKFEVWVNVPELSPDQTTTISLYYGNQNQEENLSSNFTWNKNYAGVWHFHESLADATNNGNNAIDRGAASVKGLRGNALKFNGVKNVSGSLVHIADNGSLDLQEEGTVEAWININSFQDWAGLIYKGDKVDFSDDAYFIQFLGGPERKRLSFGIADSRGNYSYERSAIDLAANEWYHIAFTWDQEKMVLYVNGYEYGSRVNSAVARNTEGGLNIGSQLSNAPTNSPFDGIIDEVRISKIARSQQWIKTSYKNQQNPGKNILISQKQPTIGHTLLNTKKGKENEVVYNAINE